jgi:hypothetical protein
MQGRVGQRLTALTAIGGVGMNGLLDHSDSITAA